MMKQILTRIFAGLSAIVVLQLSIFSVSANPFVLSTNLKNHSQNQSKDRYRIKSKDILQIDIFDVCIYNPSFEVDERGNIEMNMVGVAQAAERTVAELEAELTEKLRKYLKEPKVRIRVIEKRT